MKTVNIFAITLAIFVVFNFSANQFSSLTMQSFYTFLIFLAYFFCFFIIICLFKLLIESCIFYFKVLNIHNYFENYLRKVNNWPSIEEEFILESLFYSNIHFDELYKFLNFVKESTFIAFINNASQVLLSRSEDEGYWLLYNASYLKNTTEANNLDIIISYFMEVLVDDKIYYHEIEMQKVHNLQLQNINTNQLLIAILRKEEVKKILLICDKYYKMIIDKRLHNKNYK